MLTDAYKYLLICTSAIIQILLIIPSSKYWWDFKKANNKDSNFENDTIFGSPPLCSLLLIRAKTHFF